MNTQHRGRAAFAVCGSFCTLGAAAAQAEQLVRQGWELLPVMSFAASRLDTRFGRASEWKERLEQLTGHPVLDSLQAVEPLGPKRLAEALVGWITGSLYMVAVVTGTGLAAISGSGSADTAAISAVMVPEMRKRRYNIDLAAAVIAASGALASIIPPSIVMIVIAITSNQSIGAMFLGGVVPGVMVMACSIDL